MEVKYVFATDNNSNNDSKQIFNNYTTSFEAFSFSLADVS